jgi:hypothetical protein
VLSPDGRLRFTTNENEREVQDVPTGALRRRLRSKHAGGTLFGNEVNAFSPDGVLFASKVCDWEQKERVSTVVCRGIQVWETATGNPVALVSEDCDGNLFFAPDGRTLVVVGEGAIRAWDAVTGERVYRQPVAPDLLPWNPNAAAISPDGRRLAVALSDTTVAVWDLSAAADRVAARGPVWGAADGGALWDDLAGDDAERAAAAIDRLASDPREAVALLRRRLKPAAGVPTDKLNRLLADLDDDDTDVRDAASRRLAKLGEQAEPALYDALSLRLSGEQRRRVLAVLASAAPAEPSPERLSERRAVRALEQMDTPAARGLLDEWAGGGPNAPPTRDARAALARRASRQ